MLALLGSLLGGVFRIIPEFLKFKDKQDERKHEREMFNLQLQADKLRFEAQTAHDQMVQDTTEAKAEWDAIMTATKAQAVKSGIRWIDGLNSLMRPILTFWWAIFLYTAALTCEFIVLWHTSSAAESILLVFGESERAIAASIISFWFVDRSLRKGAGV